MNKTKQHLEEILPKIIEIRKTLHQIPELKYEEFKTSKQISDVLKSFGYEVNEGIAKTGLTALLDTGKPGKTIGIRADMDALPIEEPDNHACRSQHPGKMHACGHDGHCATVLAVAYVLQQIKHELRGKIKFIFQPAEEGGKGSTAMIEASVLAHPTVDEIYGFHNWPGLPENVVATRRGTILVGNGRIEISIQGKPAHTAQPEHAINPVTIGAELIVELEKLRSQLHTIILNIFSFNSGEFKRGMSDHADIVGVYYAETEADLENLTHMMQTVCEKFANKFNTKIDVAFKPFHSPTINTTTEAEKILSTAIKLYGDAHVKRLEKSMIAAEDFSEYLRHIPGCFFLVGAGEHAKPVHTNQFQFNDNVIAVAASVMCELVVDSH